MITLVTLLLVSFGISASLRLAGYSKKKAVFFGIIPWTIWNLISLTNFMILRTPEGRVISKTEQFLTGMLVPVLVAMLAAFFVRKKEPNQTPEPIPPRRDGSP